MKQNNYASLQKLFLESAKPTQPDGFYKGELLLMMPKTSLEKIESIFLHLWLPWHGKSFNAKTHRGNNSLPVSLSHIIRMSFAKAIINMSDNQLHAFPFTTSFTKGILDNVQTLRLNYDLPENPPFIRQVVDELVQIEKDTYLGKANIQNGGKVHAIAFFKLTK